MGNPTFSIITPSYQSSAWLKLCVASVADQQGVELEHIVQDSCSTDGTQDWLPTDKRVKAVIEKDQGMYDAINRGFKRSEGEILAYLNCDEQYLPGALKEVKDYFAAHPQVDVLFADSLVTDAEGNYISSRYSLAPRKHELWIRLAMLTSSLFVRRSVVHQHGIWFDTKWRGLGDFFWILEMVKHNLQIKVLPSFTSIFTDTGDNLCLTPNSLRERHAKWDMTPTWIKLVRAYFVMQYRIRLAARGSIIQKPFEYSIYTLANPHRRITKVAARPTSFWAGRSKQTVPELAPPPRAGGS